MQLTIQPMTRLVQLTIQPMTRLVQLTIQPMTRMMLMTRLMPMTPQPTKIKSTIRQAKIRLLVTTTVET
jgi:hypothetical protein